MELKQVGEKTYYIEHDTNIGVFKTGENSVCLIDTGSAGDGEKIDEIISGMGWSIDYIINTHTHIDHLGGNAYLMNKYGIPAYATDVDVAFANYEDLESSYMYGGKPPAKFQKVFRHPGKIGFRAIEDAKFEGISWTLLPGHTFGMIGVKTEDDIWFTGDAYLNRDYMAKHRFGYLCDVEGYLDTLRNLRGFDGKLFIPAHGEAEKDITEITQLNEANVKSIINDLTAICTEYTPLYRIFQKMYEALGMRSNIVNHSLLSSTIKCYLTYLEKTEKMEYRFNEHIMEWKVTY